MATNYERGRAFEYRVRDWLYERGAVQVIRAAGSHTKVDLTAFFPSLDGLAYIDHEDHRILPGSTMAVKIPAVWLVQCKRTGKLSKAEAEELREIAHAVGAKPYHAHTGPGGRGIELDLIT